MSQKLLQMRNIRYSYGSKKALEGIDFDLYPGETHALTGDHGSGKSTLVKLISGAQSLQNGSLIIKNHQVQTLNPSIAAQLGIGMVYQSEEIISTGTLLDNIYLGRFPHFIMPGKKESLLRQCRELFELYGFDEDPLSQAHELSPARRQVLSFMRALASGADILILDEIAQKTTPEEQENIYRLIRMCRKQRKGIIYVTSNIDEIFKVSDRVTILQNGYRKGTEDVARVDRSRLVNLAFSFTMDRESEGSQINHEMMLISRYDTRIFNDIPQGLMIISPVNEIQNINMATTKILGVDPEQIEGTDISDFFMSLNIENRDDILSAVLSRNRGLWQKLRYIQKKRLKVRVSPLGEEGDRDQGVLLFLEDISADYETREYLQQAEKFVSTAELAAGVAHEVNNPLGIIQNYLDLLYLESHSENSMDYLDRIQSELTRIVEILSSLLSFSKTGTHPQRIIDIHNLMDEVIILLGHRIRDRKVVFRKEYCAPGLKVSGHENKLKQLFINLICNAVEAVLVGGEISIRTTCSDPEDADGSVTIEITDNGYGIPDEIRDQIFTPFYSTKMTKTNTGLGLSICQHIVESYNGTITAESIPGEFTTFTVNFPLRTSACL